MKISIIAAMDEKNGIGKGNSLLFKIPEDFARMQKLTMGHPIIMGRKTFESIGRVLLGRTNIVITQNSKFIIKDLASQGEALRSYVVNSLEKAIGVAKKSPGSDEIFIFGGGQIFKEAIEKGLVDKLYLTIVEGDFGADTFFPDYPEFTHKIFEEEHESAGFKYAFLTLKKIKHA
ncbi:MAG: dihydrofolate reductase [Patescibacteria group bacterium]|nr:dihydrofolate reductase [Patescibacteria group bacterium]